jgi:hypothetical protein
MLTKNQLPETLYVLSLQLAQGFSDFLFGDKEGNLAFPAWGDGERAKAWLLGGGLELCKSGNDEIRGYLSMCHCHAVIRTAMRDEIFSQLAAQKPDAAKRFLHFEPDPGSLFSPPDRRIPLV